MSLSSMQALTSLKLNIAGPEHLITEKGLLSLKEAFKKLHKLNKLFLGLENIDTIRSEVFQEIFQGISALKNLQETELSFSGIQGTINDSVVVLLKLLSKCLAHTGLNPKLGGEIPSDWKL